MNRTILITGAAGFVGHHLVEHFLKNTKDRIIGIDCLNYSGTWDRLRDIDIEYFTGEYTTKVSAYEHPRFTPLMYDFRMPAEPNFVKELSEVTHVIHMGAESHVDNSIKDPMKFTITNVNGTVNMLNLARDLPNLELFVYFSTDEVFGPAPFDVEVPQVNNLTGEETIMVLPHKGFSENARHDPKNPYAASKSAAEQMVVSFANTYSLPCIITRQMNIFGERQHAEKFLPICMRKGLYGGKIQIHASPDKKQAGVRSYIHARNVADAHLFLLDKQPWLTKKGVESYHIVGEQEVDNLTLAKLIDQYVGHLGEVKGFKPEGVDEFEMVDFHSSRPGHDLRYALDGRKMASLGWKPPKDFHESLRGVVDWTLDNLNWLGEDE